MDNDAEQQYQFGKATSTLHGNGWTKSETVNVMGLVAATDSDDVLPRSPR